MTLFRAGGTVICLWAMVAGTAVLGDDKTLATQIADIKYHEEGFCIDLFCRAAKDLLAEPVATRPERVRAFFRLMQPTTMDETERFHRRQDCNRSQAMLCQLLFITKRRSGLGSPSTIHHRSLIESSPFPTGSDFRLSEPVLFYKGMPIDVVLGYAMGGREELGKDYLERCLTTSDWVERVFDPVDRDQMTKLMEEFISRQRPQLEAHEKEFFRRQLRKIDPSKPAPAPVKQ